MSRPGNVENNGGEDVESLGGLCHRISQGTFEEFYSINMMLGKGSDGSVFRARHVPTGYNMAVKIIEKQDWYPPSFLARLMSEISILQKLNHENIIRLQMALHDDNNFYIVTDLCRNGDLSRWLTEENNTSELAVLRVVKQALSALTYLHSNGVVHRDIKLENIGFSGNRVELIDFGFAAECQPGQLLSNYLGTDGYRSPEMVARRAYCPRAADVYAMGIVLYELLTCDRQHLLDKWNLQNVSKPTVRLLHDMTRTRPSKRLPAEVALVIITDIISDMSESSQ